MEKDSVLEMRHIYKTFPGVKALQNVDFTLKKGEIHALMGENGAGKSTLIKLLDGEEVPNEGQVIVNDINVGKLRHSRVPVYRRNIGVVFQDFRLLPKMTVFENIAFALEILAMGKIEIRRRVREVLDLVDLRDKAKAFPSELSG